jgi:hypothetical protein
MSDKQWTLKTNDDGAPIVDGTKVVFVDPDGKELALDPPQMYGKILDLGKEAKKHREKVQELSGVVSLFEGIEDLEKWKDEAVKAIDTVKNFNDKDWMAADKVERLKREMTESYEQKLNQHKASFEEAVKTKDGVIQTKDQQIHRLLISNNFAVHPLFGGPKPKTKLSPDLAEAYFSKHFRLEENPRTKELTLIAYQDPGRFETPIYSRENPGEVASFSEAMNELWDKFPGKDQLMDAPAGGAGAKGGSGGTPDLDNLAALRAAHAEAIKKGDAKTAIVLKNKIHEAMVSRRT